MITNFSSNTTIKINGGGSGTTGSGSGGSLSTASNEYIILSLSGNNGCNVSINGATSAYNLVHVMHMGPSQTISWSVSGTGSIAWSYVRFSNSP